jgi:hypothetical protein
MNLKYQELYDEMIIDMKSYQDQGRSELEEVEYAFKVALGYCELVRRKMENHEFSSEKEEVIFFKEIIPAFTSQIELLTLVNQGLLFEPKQNSAARTAFWENEVKRKDRFIWRNSDFVRYIENGDTDKDLLYFVMANSLTRGTKRGLPGEMDSEFCSLQDQLLAKLLAQKKYHQYVLEKLSHLTNQGNKKEKK